MKSARLLFILTLALVILVAIGNAETTNNRETNYRLHVRVEPTSHRLEAEVWIERPPSSQFKLSKDFSIREIIADGKSVSFHRDPSSVSNVVVDVPPARELHLSYSGEINGVISGVNMIGPDLVELALYSSWYPRFDGSKDLAFELETNLPQTFLSTTNGKQIGKRRQNGRLITRWKSYRPGHDIVLLASPRLRQERISIKGTQIEMYYFQLSPEIVTSKMNGLKKAMDQLSVTYGPPKVKGVIRFVYSPRAGWGYSRIPLFVVSEKYSLQQLKQDNGEAKDFLDNCHEMAHFWWYVANMGTPDDWINEGLAEFSAFRLAEERFGGSFADARIAEYQQHANKSQSPTAIAETENASPDRYVNLYEKTTLMFLEAERRFGRESLDRALKALYMRFAGTHDASTAAFLQQVRESMGDSAENFFREELYRKGPAVPKEQISAAN